MTKKTIYYLVITGVIILGLASHYVFFANKEGSKGATLTLITEKSQYSAGEEVIIDIVLDTAEAVDGVDLVINYEHQYLKVEDETTFFTTAESVFANFLGPEIDTEAGLIKISAITSPGESFTGKGKVVSLSFLAQEKGGTQISFLFEQGNTVDSNVSSFREPKDILSKTTNVSLTIY